MSIIRGNIVDVVNKRIYKGEIHFTDKIEKIVEKDVSENEYIMPGLVNAHVHIESSMLSPSAFSKYAIKHGTVAVVSDPHEIANVCGISGLNYMLENAQQSPLKIFYGVPSCVPATSFETSGAHLDSKIVEQLLSSNHYTMLSEMMNFPGVVSHDAEVWAKINASKKYNKPIDGHAPQLTGDDLKKYVAAGISTDHECSTLQEAIEKINLGMKIIIREGSAAKNFDTLSPLIEQFPENIMFCTDDSHPDDLLDGHINKILQRAWKLNFNYFNVLRAATLIPIYHYNLPVGLLQANDNADFVVSNNANLDIIQAVYINGKNQINWAYKNDTVSTINSWNPATLSPSDLQISPTNKNIHVISCADGQLLTEDAIIPYASIFDEQQKLKYGYDKIVVINRYHPAKPTVGIIKNVNLRKGAFGGTIAHDSHNIIITGHDDESIISVFHQLCKTHGGIAAVLNDNAMLLPLPIGGLMTDDDAFIVSAKYKQLQTWVREILGSTLNAPFMTLSFMALLVIPELKISDKGLFNILSFNYVPLIKD